MYCNAREPTLHALKLCLALICSMAQKWDVCENLAVTPEQISSIFRRMYPDMHVSSSAITRTLPYFVLLLPYCAALHLKRN